MIRKVISVAQMSTVLGVSLQLSERASQETDSRSHTPGSRQVRNPVALLSTKKGLGRSLSIRLDGIRK